MTALTGVNAPKQSRSRKTTEAFLQVGRRKLEEAGIDGLSMSEVAAEAGSSVGALYFRFGDKSQFLGAILAQALAETGETFTAVLEDAATEQWSPEELLRRWIAAHVDVFGKNRALLRAVQRHALAQPEAWQPIRTFGRDMAERLLRRLDDASPRLAIPDWQRRVRIGLQVVHGALMHMLVSSHGLLTLEDAATTKAELAAVVIGYLRAGAPR
jgi:AcrR family transcriptional regulator